MAAKVCALLAKIIFTSGSSAGTYLTVLCAGHVILRTAHIPEYVEYSVRSSAAIGAVGGAFVGIPITLTMQLASWLFGLDSAMKDGKIREGLCGLNPCNILISFIAMLGLIVGWGAAAGAIGSALLRKYGHHVIGVLAATRAGAVGTAVLGPGVIVAVLLMTICCTGTILGIANFVDRKPRGRRDEQSEEEAEKEV
ncbi:SubName: Full=Uncharacterized protein {ECO:0000313/EMBL:CCA67383.1} [Serendipita indica DSM 11827]|nr:SubName: Full=Uncharacterized protein {ECO:0000313/EMBL:CCA67383.1} [Serendipita indica DSM 11827]